MVGRLPEDDDAMEGYYQAEWDDELWAELGPDFDR